jgi:hypothetical protein
MTEPQIIEVNCHYSGDGKIALAEYGKESSGYSMSLSQRYTIPPDWTEDQALEFQLGKILELKEAISPILNEERDIRIDARY